jgi:hypothetical protein
MIPLLHLHSCLYLSRPNYERNTKESEADGSCDTKESEADDSSVSSLSASESIWEKGYHLPKEEAVSSKSNPVTLSSPHQRQAKQPNMDSPTSSVISPIEKRRFHVF